MRDIKTKKAVTCIYKGIYYTISTFAGWYTLKDSFILPESLGGSGSLENIFQDFPYITPPKHYHLYFTVSMGYHVHALFHQIICNSKSNDYYEMILHHLVTIYLFIFSYIGNLLVGALVAFVHDISDIFVCWSRTFGET